LAKEVEIAEELLKTSGKPANIIEKIMLGKVSKYYEDVCLAKQKYIKNEDLSIEQHLNEIGKKLGITVVVKQFARFGIGGK
jgi:elongation factor Ts